MGNSLSSGRDESTQDINHSLTQVSDSEGIVASAITAVQQLMTAAVGAPASLWNVLSNFPYRIFALVFPEHAVHSLLNVASEGKLDEMRAWLQAGVHPDSKSASGQTALTTAAYEGFADAVELLLQAGASVDIADTEGRTPLMNAAEGDHWEVMKILLNAKADVNARDTDGYSPLTVAASSGLTAAVDILLSEHADIATVDIEGYTPLMFAAQGNYLGVMKALLRAGAAVDARNVHGHSALMLAARWGGLEAVNVLRESGASLRIFDLFGCTPLASAAEGNQLEVIETLLLGGADVNDNSGGWPALGRAARGGHAEAMNLLLENGAHIDIRDKFDHTPLMWACHTKHLELAETLLKNGADLNAEDRNGHTALRHAVHAGNFEVMDFLLKCGAQFNVESYGHTSLPSLQTAIEKKCWHVVDALIAPSVTAFQNDLKLLGLWPLTPISRAGLTQQLVYALEAGHHQITTLLISALDTRGDAFVKNEDASGEGLSHVGPLTLLEFAARTAPIPIVLGLLSELHQERVYTEITTDENPEKWEASPAVRAMLEQLQSTPQGNEAGANESSGSPAHVGQAPRLNARVELRGEPGNLPISREDWCTPEPRQADYTEHLNRALAAAVHANRRDVIQALMALGADPYARFDDRLPAISAAKANGNLDTFHTLTGS